MKLFYVCILIAIVVFSYGFIDPNFPYQPFPEYFRYVHSQRTPATAIYIALLLSLYACYSFILSRSKLSEVWQYIWITVLILFFAYPAFSSDIFNYIATSKMVFLYKENPYVVMPIEIPNEPSLAYLHASNKVALYGWSWIVLTGIPYVMGKGNIVMQMLAMKMLIVGFYFWLLTLLERASSDKAWTLAFFGLNPLVVMETFVAAHNDVVMMAFAVCSLMLVLRKRLLWSFIFLILSVFVKGATVALVPLYLYIIALRKRKKTIESVQVWRWSTVAMAVPFLLSPIREEMYPWYFVWVLTFVSLLPRQSFLGLLSMVTSFGLELRIAPYLLTWRWDGITPLVKKILTAVPPAVLSSWYAIKKKI